MEQKDLRKKQRRSDRYYSNKETKDSDSGEGENADGERQEEVQEGAGVPASGVEEGKYIQAMRFCIEIDH